MAGFADRIFRIKNSAPGPGIEGSRITRFRPSLVASVRIDLVCGVPGNACCLFSLSPNVTIWLVLGMERVDAGGSVIDSEHYHDDNLPQEDRNNNISGKPRRISERPRMAIPLE